VVSFYESKRSEGMNMKTVAGVAQPPKNAGWAREFCKKIV